MCPLEGAQALEGLRGAQALEVMLKWMGFDGGLGWWYGGRDGGGRSGIESDPEGIWDYFERVFVYVDNKSLFRSN